MNAAQERLEIRRSLMLATLPHVVFDGWTLAAMNAGARDLELDAIALKRYFPGGPREMVALFSDWADDRMREALVGAQLPKVHQRIAFAVRARLEALLPYREATRRTLSFLALPANAGLATRCLFRTVDAMWYAAGDRSADFSYYTKRATLAGVYSTTFLYWLDDRSEDSEATWAFLDRRLQDVLRIGKARSRAERALSGLPNPLKLLREGRCRAAAPSRDPFRETQTDST